MKNFIEVKTFVEAGSEFINGAVKYKKKAQEDRDKMCEKTCLGMAVVSLARYAMTEEDGKKCTVFTNDFLPALVDNLGKSVEFGKIAKSFANKVNGQTKHQFMDFLPLFENFSGKTLDAKTLEPITKKFDDLGLKTFNHFKDFLNNDVEVIVPEDVKKCFSKAIEKSFVYAPDQVQEKFTDILEKLWKLEEKAESKAN
jgi:hypothetical protein|tara:strand:- start:1857 stop:2450 length:594 start_codon:yes stop_codon:yes gene_type:complete